MSNKKAATIWVWAKKIFFWVFVVHMAWFFYFIWEKFSVTDFIVAELRTKMLIVLSVGVLLGVVYYVWLRHIAFIHKTALVFREIFFIGYIVSFLYLLFGIFFNPPITITQIGSLVEGNGLSRDYVSLRHMSPYIKLAVISSEDQYFLDHDGFDLLAIKRAMKYNQQHTKRKQGASTISQQVAKNVFLWQGGGFLRKGIEVFFTFSIEKLWSKKTILERYLNIAEMGKGIFGIQAASKRYFNKDAKDLTRAEAAMIAACLPNPKKFTVKPLSNYVANRYDDILLQMSYLEPDPDVQELIKN